MSLKCPNPKCGKELSDGSRFCKYCGTPLDQMISEYNNDENESEKVAVSAEPPLSDDIENNNVQKRTFVKRIGIVAIIGLAITAVLLFFINHFQSPQKTEMSAEEVDRSVIVSEDKEENDTYEVINTNEDNYGANPCNAIEGGPVARNDRFIYYINNPYTVDNKNNKYVVRMNIDSGERKILFNGKNYKEMYLLEDSLLLLGNDGVIYKSDLKGYSSEELISDEIGWFTVVDGYIFYNNSITENVNGESVSHGDGCLYRVDIDGANKIKLTDIKPDRVYFDDNKVIYCVYDESNVTFYTEDFDGSNSQVLFVMGREDISWDTSIYKGKLYYTIEDYEDENLSGIYAYDISSGETDKIVATMPEFYSFWNDKLLYTADSNTSDSALYMSNLDGTNPQELMYFSSWNAFVVGDYLYSEHGNNASYSYINLNTMETGSFEEIFFENLIYTEDYLLFTDAENNNIFKCDHNGKKIVKLADSNCQELYYYNGNIYYEGSVNGYDEDNDYSGLSPYGLFELDVDGKGAIWIDEYARQRVIFDDHYAYYESSWDPTIYRTDLNSVEDLKEDVPFLYDSNHYGSPYFVIDDWLYVSIYEQDEEYKSSYHYAGVMRVKLDKSISQSVIKGGYSLQYYDGKIYYLNTNDKEETELRRMNPDGGSDEIVLTTPIQRYYIDNDVIYYIDSTYRFLNSIKIDGTQRKHLTDVVCEDFVIGEDKIYYTNKYDHGDIYSISLGGDNPQRVVDYRFEYNDATDYTTKGIDDYIKVEKEEMVASYESTDIMSFDDPEFESFLCTMFNKDPGTITGADLLSVKYLGYYEGAPEHKSELVNYGATGDLYENCVYFSTEDVPDTVNKQEIMFYDAGGDTLLYKETCEVMTVVSNEWMVSHVMPNLYYFKNLQLVFFGYCWVDNVNYPEGTENSSINLHSRYSHAPY